MRHATSIGYPLGFSNTPGGMHQTSRRPTQTMRKAVSLNALKPDGAAASIPPSAEMRSRTMRADHASGPATATSVRPQPPRPPASAPPTRKPPRAADESRIAQIDAARQQIHDQVRAEAMMQAATRPKPTPLASEPPPKPPATADTRSVYGEVSKQTTVYHCEASDDSLQADLMQGRLRATRSTEVPVGTRMHLFYPQVQMAGESSIFMRTHLVDPYTADITEGWAIVYQTVDGKPVRYVTNFSV